MQQSQYPEEIEFDILYTERYNIILKEDKQQWIIVQEYCRVL